MASVTIHFDGEDRSSEWYTVRHTKYVDVECEGRLVKIMDRSGTERMIAAYDVDDIKKIETEIN